jgi:hypothetical protein
MSREKGKNDDPVRRGVAWFVGFFGSTEYAPASSSIIFPGCEVAAKRLDSRRTGLEAIRDFRAGRGLKLL